jgi:hypothetical protein
MVLSRTISLLMLFKGWLLTQDRFLNHITEFSELSVSLNPANNRLLLSAC